ncbi:hypothetical protein FHW12_000432 [Dokdonella fugitiva]|uniref:Uncharacterized protein n=1 Tax=Dokdonella fugitiva TaxID=328517 RepID=A0A839F1Y6_9GAMM|nr:hypothetical protein [Dokdonella fugitiva]MBA8886241.1 hypothetical protein [Dokdonella fugitiva]
MRTTPMLLAALFAIPCSAASDEPPTQLRIQFDGREYVTSAGAPIEVDVGGRKARLRVDEMPWRHFVQGSLQFDYPRHFPWESDPSPPRSWTLDGNDAVIMVFEQPATQARDPEDVAAGFEKTLGAKAPAEHAKAVLRTEHAGTLTGVASTVRLATSTISHEVFALGKGDHAWLLVLQDALDEQGDHSSEYIEMRKRLSATLEF